MVLPILMTSTPLVSVVLVCRCEARHIRAALDSILAQEEPAGGFEIVVADGMSEDGTREVLREIVSANPKVRVVDNPARHTASGLNTAIRAATGNILVRMDAHTRYAPDYLRQCVAVLQSTGADNVGGPWIACAENYMGVAIAAAFQSPFAVGGARSHVPDYEGEVDSVYLGCWRREVFERFGHFDETLARNQDDEHNLRIVRGGGRIWQSAKIRSWYHTRTTLGGLFRQYLQYGYWKVFVIQKHGRPASLRHLVPGIFVFTLFLLGLACGVAFLASTIFPSSLVERFASTVFKSTLAGLVSVLVLYLLAVLIESFRTARRTNWNLLPALPVVFSCYHFSYGIGFLRGVLDRMILRRPPPASMTGLTREYRASREPAMATRFERTF